MPKRPLADGARCTVPLLGAIHPASMRAHSAARGDARIRRSAGEPTAVATLAGATTTPADRRGFHMSIRRFSLAALAVVALAACSSGSPAATGTAGSAATAATAPAAASQAPAATSGPTAAAATPAGPAVAGGGATDFCSAYQEYKDAVQADTPDAQGAGFRAAATDMRTYAPAEIKAAAGFFADVLDQVGQDLQAGKPNPGTLGSGQSAERRQGLADTITWITANCP
jgi:hypothetical protein